MLAGAPHRYRCAGAPAAPPMQVHLVELKCENLRIFRRGKMLCCTIGPRTAKSCHSLLLIREIAKMIDTKENKQVETPASSTENKSHLKPYDYKLGIKDNDGKEVVKIYTKAPGYIIYRTDNTIRLDMDDDHKDIAVYAKNHYKLGIQLAKIYALLPEHLSSTESINRLVARAITTNVAGNFEDAQIILSQAELKLIKLNIIQGRLQYTLGAFILALIIFAISLLPSIATFIPKSYQVTFHEEFQLFSNIMLLGALGGILSIAISYRSLNIDIYADNNTNRLVGLSRIAIAVIASIFIYFSIKSKLIFAFLNEQPEPYGLYTFAMVAGFIEMLVPSLMNNLAKDAKVSQEEISTKAQEPKMPLPIGGEIRKKTRTFLLARNRKPLL